MVRYPESHRRSLGDLENLRVRTPGGIEVPFATAARVEVTRGPSSIHRTDRQTGTVRTPNPTASGKSALAVEVAEPPVAEEAGGDEPVLSDPDDVRDLRRTSDGERYALRGRLRCPEIGLDQREAGECRIEHPETAISGSCRFHGAWPLEFSRALAASTKRSDVGATSRVQHVDRPFREPVHENDAIADDRDLGGHREKVPVVKGNPGQRELGHGIR